MQIHSPERKEKYFEFRVMFEICYVSSISFLASFLTGKAPAPQHCFNLTVALHLFPCIFLFYFFAFLLFYFMPTLMNYLRYRYRLCCLPFPVVLFFCTPFLCSSAPLLFVFRSSALRIPFLCSLFFSLTCFLCHSSNTSSVSLIKLFPFLLSRMDPGLWILIRMDPHSFYPPGSRRANFEYKTEKMQGN